ncbi:hypothetical protein DM02DRAFT_475658, partial [Periconia macrospinosa]
EPCARVSAASSSSMAATPKASTVYILAKDAMECLRSVPLLDVEGNALLTEELKAWFQFQSTLSYQKNPPETMKDRRIDLLGDLDRLAQGLDEGHFTNEFDFMFQLWLLSNNAYDFHFFYTPDIINVFTSWVRGNPEVDNLDLVSISRDGRETPQIYNYEYLVNESRHTNPHPVRKINGIDVEDFLHALAVYPQYNDINARYNKNFPNQASMANGDNGSTFNSNTVIEGEKTLIEYSDGFQKSYLNYATIDPSVTWDGVVNGQTFFNAFLNKTIPKKQPAKRNEPSEEPSTKADPSVIQSGYPSDPVVIHSAGIIAGYFLKQQGYDDTAVLSITSFEPRDDQSNSDFVEFQDVVNTFLSKSTEASKSRLIIDLRANGGGALFLGFDTFHQLFPTVEMHGLTRIRKHKAVNITANVVTKVLTDVTPNAATAACDNDQDSAICAAWQSELNYKLYLNGENKPYQDAISYFDPYTYNNDEFTDAAAYNFNDITTQSEIPLTGFLKRKDLIPGKQTFASQNIILVQDGGCGSTCAIFSELMKTQGKVRQVVLGGEPQPGTMQGVSGSKGGQVLEFSQIADMINTALKLQPSPDISGDPAINTIINPSKVFKRGTGRINWRNNMRLGDKSATPLEFIYEAADCRLWYTKEMYQDITHVWTRAAHAMWEDTSYCVPGST